MSVRLNSLQRQVPTTGVGNSYLGSIGGLLNRLKLGKFWMKYSSQANRLNPSSAWREVLRKRSRTRKFAPQPRLRASALWSVFHARLATQSGPETIPSLHRVFGKTVPLNNPGWSWWNVCGRFSPLPRSFPQADWNSRLKWPGELMPFQQHGVRALLDMDRLLLADDMGLGKTIQAIAAMRILKARREIESCLVVAPASVLDQWRREIAKWAPELSAIIIRGSAADRSWQWDTRKDVILTSYETLRSDFGNNRRSQIRKRTWDVIVADEAQRVKNRNPTSSALKGLRRVRSWALTGTPIENNEEELASIIEFIDNDGIHPPKRYRPGVELLNRHRELQLRRKKGDVLEDLPPKLVTKLTVELPPKQRASYRKAEEEGIIYLKSLGAEVGVTHVLELITRLKQICNADPKTGESIKLDDMKNRLEQLTTQGHKALIFSQYTNDISGVAAAVNHLREFNPLRLTGDMPQSQRADVIERFKSGDEHKVLAMSLRAGGLGLNLQEASYVFHLDRWWNPAVERQAEDRSHRMGPDGQSQRHQVLLHGDNRRAHRQDSRAKAGLVRPAR